MKQISILLLMLLLVAAPGYSKGLSEKEIQLNGFQQLKIVELGDFSTAVSVLSDDRTYHMVTIENSAMSQATKVRFCSSCTESYFISLYDRSSTYGSTTGIIAWQDADGGWYLQVLPFSVAGIEDEDNDGIFELVDQYSGKTENKFQPVKMKYTFKNGLICPK